MKERRTGKVMIALRDQLSAFGRHVDAKTFREVGSDNPWSR